MRRVIFGAFAVIVALVVIGVIFVLSSAAPPLTETADDAIDVSAPPPAQAQIYAAGRTTQLTLPDSLGKDVVREEVQFTEAGPALQVTIANKILLSARDKGLIDFDTAAPALSARIWQETLHLEMDPRLAEASLRDLDAERVILISLVNSALDSSGEFMDVQFLVNGKRPPHLLGHLKTENPLGRQE